MANEREYDLKRIIDLFLHKLWLILLISFLGGVVGYCYSKYMIAPMYTSHVSMYIRSANEENYSSSREVSLSEMNVAQSLVWTYKAVLQDDTVMDAVGEKVIEHYGVDYATTYFVPTETGVPTILEPESIRNCFTMEDVDSTELLKITATTADPYLSVFLCNTIAELAPDYLVRVVGAGSIEVIGPAKVKLRKVSPSNGMNAIIGAMIGFVIVAGGVFLKDSLNNSIKEKDDLIKRYEKAVIGEIASYGNGKKNHSTLNQARQFGESMPFYVEEAYKAMRTNLLFALSTSEKKIAAVSSANPGEGKTTTIANLSVALAQMGKRVLLIDADMRKPMQQKQFGLPNKLGLSSLLAQMSPLEEVLQKGVMEHLDVITSGPQPPNPSELIASDTMKNLLLCLESEYDYILIDTPPINVVSDALGLRDAIGGVFLVLKHGSTTYDEMDNILEKLEFAKINLLGFVINNIKRKTRRGYGYRSSYKYSYYKSYSDDGGKERKNRKTQSGEEQTKKNSERVS